MTIDRRTILLSSLMSGFTRAVARAQSAPIHTSAAGLVAGPVRIPVADGRIPAYAARPAGAGPFPVILVVEEIFGVDEYIQDVCRRFAHAGALAVAPELYARFPGFAALTDPHEIIRTVIDRAPDDLVLSDLDAAARWAGGAGGDLGRLGVNGFCRGGRDTWLFCEHSRLPRAAVAWYGPVRGAASAIQPADPVDGAGALHCPLLGLYGGADPSIDPADVERAAAIARAAGQEVEIKVFPGAGHGFHADYRASYSREAAVEGWADALAWFRTHGVL